MNFIGSVFLWSYVYNIVRISSIGSKKQGTENLRTEATSLSDGTFIAPPEMQVSTQDTAVCEQLEDPGKASSPKIEELNENRKVLFSFRFKKILSTLSANIDLKKLLAPSTIAVIVGYAVGVLSPIRNIFVGDSAPFRVIQTSIAVLGYE
ncbi:hypothetical protein ACLOJK_041515 [Asimina triloba]